MWVELISIATVNTAAARILPKLTGTAGCTATIDVSPAPCIFVVINNYRPRVEPDIGMK